LFFANLFRLIRNIFLFLPTIPLVLRGLFSKQVPLRLKLIPLLGFFYFFSPLSRIFSGVFDDVFIFFLLLSLFASKTRSYFEKTETSENHKSEKEKNKTIEGEYSYKDDND